MQSAQAPAVTPPSESGVQRWRTRLLDTTTSWASYPALAVLLIVSAIVEPAVVTKDNLLLTIQAITPVGLLAIGETFVILTGGIDLSVGATMGLVNWLSASMIDGSNARTPLVCLLCVGIGALVGLINGSAIAWLRIPPFVMTLGMLFVVNAVGLLYTNGTTTGSASSSMIAVGSDRVGGFPASGFVLIGWFLIALVVLFFTPFGRRVYATGANPRAARVSGLPVNRTLILAYVVCGVSAALAGLLITGYIHGASTSTGANAELDAIAAAAVGGIVLSGGRGSVVGTIGGTLFLGVLFNLLVQLDVGEYAREIGEGVAIAAAGVVYGRIGGLRIRT